MGFFNIWLSLWATVFFVGIFHNAEASEDKKRRVPATIVAGSDEEFQTSFALQSPTAAADIFSRTQYVLTQHYGLTPEPSYQAELDSFAENQSLKGLNEILQIFDPYKQFQRFSVFEAAGRDVVHGFRDRDTRQVPDFSIPLAQNQKEIPAFASFQPTPNQPLAGLRIALDPGHMGGDLWDDRTGKFVNDKAGHKISEGVINLQTCLLLKERFQKEGAQVFVTHEVLGPVTSETWEGLNLSRYIPQELFGATLEPWFLTLVQKYPEGPSLNAAFDHNAEIKKIFSEEMRWDYFVIKEDIGARVRLIENFKPDLTIIVHYDASEIEGDPNGVNPKNRNATKVYVPGSFAPMEFASRASRRDLAKHIFNPFWWNQSVDLARSLLTQLESTLKIKGDTGQVGDSVSLEPGLQSRNLSLNRQIADSAVAYVEALFYNDPSEFASFLKADHTMKIGGANFAYSDRLVQVVDALEKGTLNFATKIKSN